MVFQIDYETEMNYWLDFTLELLTEFDATVMRVCQFPPAR